MDTLQILSDQTKLESLQTKCALTLNNIQPVHYTVALFLSLVVIVIWMIYIRLTNKRIPVYVCIQVVASVKQQ